MQSVSSVATKIAVYINKNVENASSVAVLKMSIVTLINYFIIASLVLIVCMFTGDFLLGMLALIMMPLLRQFSGGIHLKSSNACNVVSALLILLAIYIPINYYFTGMFIVVISIIIMLLYAPQGIQNVSRLDAKYYPILKMIAILMISTNFYFQSAFLALLFFLQAITIIPPSQKLVDYYKL